MDERTIERLAADIEDLKKSVKRNDPMLRAIVAPPGWTLFSLVAGLMVSAFALPAHVLVANYGSFSAIPPAWKAALFAVLAMFAVGGGLLKIVILSRRATALGGRGFMGAALAFFGGPSAHVSWPIVFLIAGSAVLSFAAGKPWYILPSSAMLFGVMANYIAVRSGQSAYFAVGYWSLASGAACLPFLGSAPFLCLFGVYGGMFLAFAAALIATGKGREPGEGKPA